MAQILSQINQCNSLISFALFNSLLFMQESMYKNSQWPECERHNHFIHNECNALFMLTCAQYLFLTICFLNKYRSRKVFAKIMQ